MKTILLLLTLLYSICLFSQDTVFHSPKVILNTDQFRKLSQKGYHGEYSLEEIRYSPTHRRFEYCYYINNNRQTIGADYHQLNDTTIYISDFPFWNISGDSVKIHYHKMNDEKYFVYRRDSIIYEYGYASSIFPLKFIKETTTKHSTNLNTLWKTKYPTDYSVYTQNHTTTFPQVTNEQLIFEYYEVNTPPTLPNGDTIPIINLNIINYAYGEPSRSTSTHLITCIISSNGEVLNISNAIGQIESSQDLMLIHYKISSMDIKPAIIDGEAVAVRWFFKINDLSHPGIKHPAFEDTKQNRKTYIELNPIHKH